MKKKSLLLTLFLISLTLLSACVPVRNSSQGKLPRKIYSKAGRSIQYFTFSIASNYDPRLDNVIKNYKLLPIVMKNYSLKAIGMDLEKDKWVVIGEKGQAYPVLNSLKLKDPVAWRNLPETVKNLIDYPEILPIEYSVTFDVLLPKNANLQYFKEIRFYSASLNQEFVIEQEY